MKQFFLVSIFFFLVGCGSTNPAQSNQQNQSPIAQFSVSSASGVAPHSVSFDATASTDADGSIASYRWDFGDGKQATGQTPSHSFEAAGSFTVNLTVTDNDDATALSSSTITVTEAETNQNATLVAAGVTVPTVKETLEEEAGEIALQGVLLATQATSSSTLTTTGTLTQNGNGFSYAASPTDRLRIEFSNKTIMEYVFTSLSGDFNAESLKAFINSDHDIRFRLSISDGTDAEFASVKSGIDYGTSVKGVIVSEDMTYTVDLTTKGSSYTSTGSSVQSNANETTQGTVTAEGFSAIIDEGYSFKFIQVENSVIQHERTLNNSWTINGDQYALLGARIYRGLRNGKRTGTITEGVLKRNGVQIGYLDKEDNGVQIDVFLVADGEKTVIYSDLIEGG